MQSPATQFSMLVASSLIVLGCAGAQQAPAGSVGTQTAESPTPVSTAGSSPTNPVSSVTSSPPAPVAPSSTCVLRGLATARRDALLYDDQGQALAKFSGIAVALSLSGFPASPSGRVRVLTNEGQGGLQISGTMAATDVTLYAATEIPVFGRTLRIARGTTVGFAGADAESFSVTRLPSGPFDQAFSGKGTCESVSLVRLAPVAAAPPNLRGYVLRQNALDLFSQAGESVPVTRITRAPGAVGVLFYGGEPRAGFVHLEYHGDVVVDAWVRASDVEQLPVGELVDQPDVNAATDRPVARLLVRDNPQVMRTNRPLPLRISASRTAPTIGTVAADTEIYVLDVVVGWASILPRPLTLVPPDQKSFWVAASELGL